MDWCGVEGSEAAALRAGTGPLGGVAEDRQRSVRTGWSEGREPLRKGVSRDGEEMGPRITAPFVRIKRSHQATTTI